LQICSINKKYYNYVFYSSNQFPSEDLNPNNNVNTIQIQISLDALFHNHDDDCTNVNHHDSHANNIQFPCEAFNQNHDDGLSTIKDGDYEHMPALIE